MTTPHGDPGHGDSPAAWTAVIVMLIGFAAGTVFFFLHMHVAVWICAAVVALGWVLGYILSKLGYGVNGPKYSPKSSE